MFYEFELNHIVPKASKNISCEKSEGVVDHCTEIRLFKKFRSGYKNLNDQIRSGRAKNADSEAVL